MTVSELERRMGSRELVEWQVYYSMEPFGQWRDNIHAGLIAATVANTSGRQRKAAAAEDFMLKENSPQKAKQFKAKFAHMVKGKT